MTWLLLSIIAVLALGILIAALRLNRSIRELRTAADRFAQGDLSRRVGTAHPLQLRSLARSLNQMAAQLNDRLSTVIQQRNELEAVLSSMVEGVLAVDLDERILSLNRAAAELLGLEPDHCIGRPIQEAIRNAPLQTFVSAAISDDDARQDEFTLRLPNQPGARQLQAQSAILHSADGQRVGVVIVLHDVTQLRRLQTVRQEFVANVSHEVRTPVSAIKAAIETLLSDDPHDPEMTQRFLAIVARQADRLAAIVNDLLSLARIEQDAGAIFAELETSPVRGILAAARETCQAKADARQIQLNVRSEEGLAVRMNRALLEQAVVNLVDNAVKYSPPNTMVDVDASSAGGEVVIEVRDRGRGIEPEHLSRVFERFYRTDKARSRELGGTGLGLSIVKHIAEAHGGRVAVESTPGQGSRFRIHLPQPAPAKP